MQEILLASSNTAKVHFRNKFSLVFTNYHQSSLFSPSQLTFLYFHSSNELTEFSDRAFLFPYQYIF